MSRPTGNPPPPKPSYELPPLPPSPDQVEEQGAQNSSEDVRQPSSNSTEQKSGKDPQQKKQGRPQMKQPSGEQASQSNPLLSAQSTPPPKRGRTGSMVSKLVSTWDTGASASSTSTSTTVQASSNPAIMPRSDSAKAGGARRQLGHARMASSPVSPLQVKAGPPTGSTGAAPYVPSKPPSDAPPPLVLPLSRSDAPPPPSDAPPPLSDAPPRLFQFPKMPPLSLAELGSAAPPPYPVPPVPSARVGTARSATNALSMATDKLPVLNASASTAASTSADRSSPATLPTTPPPSLTPTSPRSPVKTEGIGMLQGKDVKLELRYFIDGVLDHRIDPSNGQYTELIGELMVYVESRAGKAEIGSDARNSVMRGVIKIKDYTTTSGVFHKEVNVITEFCQPFMYGLLKGGESDMVRLKLMRAFDKVAEIIYLMSEQNKDVSTSDLLKSEEFATLMQPVEQIFMDYVCGSEHTLASSRLPEAMKKLLLAIDKHLILWFDACGSDRPKDLLQLRKNAQVGFLATRSVTAAWRNRCDEELGRDGAKKYAKMFAYLNACASNKLGDFVLDIISNQKAQPQEARSYVRAIQSPKQLIQSKGTTVIAPGSENSVIRRGKSLQATSQLISPRSTSTSDTPTSPRADASQRKLKKEEIQHQLARAKFAEQIIRKADLKALDPRFMQHLKDKIVDLSRRGFDNFKLDPIPYCLGYAKAFYAYGGNVEKAGKTVPAQVEQQLNALSDSFRLDEEPGTESDEGTSVASTTASNVADPAIGGSTTSSTTFVSSNVSSAIAVPSTTPSTTQHDDGNDSSVEVGSPSSGDDDGWGSDWSSTEES